MISIPPFRAVAIRRHFVLGVILDALCINLAIVATFFFRFGREIPKENYEAYLSVAATATAIGIFIFYLASLYESDRRTSHLLIAFRVTRSTLIAFAFIIAFAFYQRAFAFPRTVILGSFLLVDVLLISWRSAHKAWTDLSAPPERVLIFGNTSSGRLLERDIEEYSKTQYEVVGYVDERDGDPSTDARVLGGPDRLAELISEHRIDRVVLSADDRPRGRILALFLEVRRAGARMGMMPDIYETIVGGIDLRQIAGVPLLEITFGAHYEWYRVSKRTVDILAALIGILVTWPIMILCAIAIRLDSRGPVFYRQDRLGLFGRPFRIIKFRSMVADAEAQSGPKLADRNDPRVTRVGRFLRKSHLDELPQLFNVLLGDMALIGPRPEREVFIREYAKVNPAYELRLTVPPGITGLAQVNGRYDSDFEHKLLFDLVYINNVSPLLDSTILLLTVRRVLLGQNRH